MIKPVKFFSLCFVLIQLVSIQSLAALEVEWYPPEIEKGTSEGRSKVIVSGRTTPFSEILIDGESITVMKPKTTAAGPEVQRQVRASCRVYRGQNIRSGVVGTLNRGELVMASEQASGWLKVFVNGDVGFASPPCFVPLKSASLPTTASSPSNSVIANGTGRANQEGFFEVLMELPPGLSQMPVEVTAPSKEQKTFLISVDVNPIKEDIKTNVPLSTKKPPAAAKKFRLWAGAGWTYQTYAQSSTGSSDLSFQTVQAPGMVARGGYWGHQWGLDLYFRDAPGKIEATAPYQIQNSEYHWRTMDLKGLYQFKRGPGSRLWGLPSQWQLRFGGELQQIPFLAIDAGNAVTVRQHSITAGMLGIGLLLGQERDWSYEFALGYQHPFSASAEGQELQLVSPMAYEVQLGAAYKFAPGWRLGVFSYIQSLSYDYTLKSAQGVTTTGKQGLFYTTLDLRLGYEF